MRLIATLLGMLHLAACGSSGKIEKSSLYFDLAAWAEAERSDWASGKNVTKFIRLGAETDTQQLDGYDATTEWEFWVQWDINRVAWRGVFVVDTLRVGDGTLLRYQTEADNIPVRELNVWQHGNHVDSLHLRTRVRTPLHITTGDYRYVTGEYMHIIRESRRRLGKDQQLEIRLEW